MYFNGCSLNEEAAGEGDHTNQTATQHSHTRHAMYIESLRFDCLSFWKQNFDGSPDLTAPSYVLFRRVRKQNLEYVRTAHRRLQSWSRNFAHAERRLEQRLYFYELPDSPDRSSYAPSANESDEDDFEYEAFVDRAGLRG